MISAIVLAAGQSKRMGRQKMLLPWGSTTVIGTIINSLVETRINDIYVVTGGNEAEIKAVLVDQNIHYLINSEYANGEMLTSVQVGLNNLGDECEAVLIVLGDQPLIETKVIQEIINMYRLTHHKIIVPSYQMHRGHPWLVEKYFWKDICSLVHPQTLRDFLNAQNKIIDYINVDSQSVIQDIDTPDDYSRYKP
jgi:molybdenum cofactor cytidylyltransferase